MIIGNGLIAKSFSTYLTDENIIIFASGVSDSTHTHGEAFRRENELLEHAIKESNGKRLVYFSTCSVYDQSMKNSAYTAHKIRMEQLIQDRQECHTIFRLSNVVGNTSNTNTVINYFIQHIVNAVQFNVWKKAFRNIIDVDDMYLICNDLLQNGNTKNTIVNIANPRNYAVPFIVQTIEDHFKLEGRFTLTDKGGEPEIDISAIVPVIKKLNIDFGEDYLPRLLQKYFPVQ